MKKFFTAFVLLISCNMYAQNFNGQWKGGFIDKSMSAASWGGSSCDYVLDLDVDGNKVSGFSYTYFSDAGQKYYTICRLSGIADKKKKFIEITEVSRTKTNVPVDVSNSFQIHKLYWKKEGEKESLEGEWIPAPEQGRRNTGFGTTYLAKRQLTEISQLAKRINAKKDPNSSPEKALSVSVKPNVNLASITKKEVKPVAKTAIPTVLKPNLKPAAKPIIVKNDKPLEKSPMLVIKKDSAQNKTLSAKIVTPAFPKTLPVGFEKRSNNVLQTVNVENPVVKLEIYDNGEVDGDSVSIFYNGAVLMAHKKLTQNPIIINLPVNNDEINELVMYADNLGTIPPNTALLVVTDGKKRYEVRITSDLKKSGTIRFVHDDKKQE